MTKLPSLAALLATVGLLAVAPAALAGSSNDGYGDPGDRTQIDINVNADAGAGEESQSNSGVQGQQEEGNGSGVLGETSVSPGRPSQQQDVAGQQASSPGSSGGGPTPAVGSLPFTGLDLSFLLGGGIILLGMGVALRQTVRRPGAPEQL